MVQCDNCRNNDTFWLFVRNLHISGQRETSSKDNQMLSFFGTLFVHGPNTNRWTNQTDNLRETFDIALSPNLWNLYMPGLQKFIDTCDSWLVQYFFWNPQPKLPITIQGTNINTIPFKGCCVLMIKSSSMGYGKNSGCSRGVTLEDLRWGCWMWMHCPWKRCTVPSCTPWCDDGLLRHGVDQTSKGFRKNRAVGDDRHLEQADEKRWVLMKWNTQ